MSRSTFLLTFVLISAKFAIAIADCQIETKVGVAAATCMLADGSMKRFDLTNAFQNGTNSYLTTYGLSDDYVFYVTAIFPGLSTESKLPLCHFADGFTDSNSGAQFGSSLDTCWSTGDINAETWNYDEKAKTMTIESIEGQDDRKMKLVVECDPSADVPVIAPLPEDPPKEYNFQIMHKSACLAPAGVPCQPKSTKGQAIVECTGNQSTFKLDVAPAFTDCDGKPFLTSYATDNADKYYCSAIWPSVPANISGCFFSEPSAVVRQTPEGKCESLASIAKATWSYTEADQTLLVAFEDGHTLTIVCSEDSIPRISYVQGPDFQIHHQSACRK